MENEKVRRTIDLPPEVNAALAKEAVDKGVIIKKHIESILIEDAKKSKYYQK